MSIEQRIKICLLLEKMYDQKAFSEKLGLEDKSKFHGKVIGKQEEEAI